MIMLSIVLLFQSMIVLNLETSDARSESFWNVQNQQQETNQETIKASLESWLRRAKESKRYAVAASDSDIVSVNKRSAQAYLQELTARYERYSAGTDPITFLLDAQRHFVQAQLQFGVEPINQLKVLNEATKFARLFERLVRIHFDDGRVPIQDLNQATGQLKHLEIQLARIKKKFVW